ncbi:MFS transporter [Gordonia sp. SL306]|uniref:MFS transporter n=1 Tax=Gordonia sp. SL306 TaxID=2995145 RepID=UPI00226F9951|nr:MFS transporter [Gordonia sp. SL306]WAC57563.1 MFS transporter [Gordonia sp. SL306]
MSDIDNGIGSVSPGLSRTAHLQPSPLTRGTLVAAALCIFVAQFGLTVPAGLNGLFQQDFGTTASQLTWITDAFLIPVTILELSFGLLGDMFGRRRLLVIGSGILALGFTICVLTPGPETSQTIRLAVMWSGQFIAGVGAAAVIPTTLSMVAAGTHTARSRARGLSTWAAALSMGSVVSPVICGLAAKLHFGSNPYAGWKWAFIVVAILAVAVGVLAAVVAQESSSPEGRSFDWPGQITIAFAVLGFLFAVIQAPTSGWGSREVIGGFVVCAIFTAAFIFVERRQESPLLQLDLFANRNFSTAAIVTVVGMFTYLATGYITSIRLTAIQGFTPLAASVAFVVFNGVSALIQVPIASRLIVRYNPKWVLGGGLLLIAAGGFWMWQIPISHESIAVLLPPLAVSGAGMAFALTAVTAVVINTVPNHLAGMAAGWASLLRDFGFTLGPAVIGAIALGHAANQISSQVNSDPTLSQSLDAFNNSAASAPPDQQASAQAAIDAVNSGPLGANAVPSQIQLPDGGTVPFNPLQHTAFEALGSGYSIGYLVVGICALAAAVASMVFIGGQSHDPLIAPDSLED